MKVIVHDERKFHRDVLDHISTWEIIFSAYIHRTRKAYNTFYDDRGCKTIVVYLAVCLELVEVFQVGWLHPSAVSCSLELLSSSVRVLRGDGGWKTAKVLLGYRRYNVSTIFRNTVVLLYGDEGTQYL